MLQHPNAVYAQLHQHKITQQIQPTQPIQQPQIQDIFLASPPSFWDILCSEMVDLLLYMEKLF